MEGQASYGTRFSSSSFCAGLCGKGGAEKDSPSPDFSLPQRPQGSSKVSKNQNTTRAAGLRGDSRGSESTGSGGPAGTLQSACPPCLPGESHVRGERGEGGQRCEKAAL